MATLQKGWTTRSGRPRRGPRLSRRGSSTGRRARSWRSTWPGSRRLRIGGCAVAGRDGPGLAGEAGALVAMVWPPGRRATRSHPHGPPGARSSLLIRASLRGRSRGRHSGSARPRRPGPRPSAGPQPRRGHADPPRVDPQITGALADGGRGVGDPGDDRPEPASRMARCSNATPARPGQPTAAPAGGLTPPAHPSSSSGSASPWTNSTAGTLVRAAPRPGRAHVHGQRARPPAWCGRGRAANRPVGTGRGWTSGWAGVEARHRGHPTVVRRRRSRPLPAPPPRSPG
jgi:hypothetical protein